MIVILKGKVKNLKSILVLASADLEKWQKTAQLQDKKGQERVLVLQGERRKQQKKKHQFGSYKKIHTLKSRDT